MLTIRDWSDSELSRRSGVSNRAIGMYRKQDVAPGLDAVQKIARAFGVQPWEMLHPDFDPDKMKNGRYARVSSAFFVGTPKELDLLEAQAEYILSHHPDVGAPK